jgi:Zn-dependent protease with chaperone function
LLSLPWPDHEISLLGIAYFSIWIVLGFSALVAALTAWPVTLGKLASYLPGRSVPHRPLNLSDGVPFYLTAAAAFGLAMLSYWTSPLFAVSVAAGVVMTMVFRHLLETPTRAGRELLAELYGFREFLDRADSDRLNRENRPEETPEVLEKFTPYAIALGVEQGWGKELTENLSAMLEMDDATRWPRFRYVDDGEITQLGLSGRKRRGVLKR